MSARPLPRKYADKISEQWVDDDGHWFLLAPNWHIDGAHAIHESSRRKAIARLADMKPCECGDCTDYIR